MSDLRVPSINNVTIAGRLARDVELKHTSAGKPYAKTCIVNSRRYKSGDESKEISTFVDVTAWGMQAEWLAELGKGRPVIVEGHLTQNEWTDKASGEVRKRIEINAERVTPLDWGKGATAENRADSAPPTQQAPQSPPRAQFAEDDLAF